MVALGFGTENQINLDYQFFISSQSFKPRDSSRGFSFYPCRNAAGFSRTSLK